MPFAAAAVVGSAAIGAIASSSAASKAASAANHAADLQAQTAAANAARSQPFVDLGTRAIPQLEALNLQGAGPNYIGMSQDAMPGQMTQAQLEATPGYQFNRSQGLMAVQNAAAAKGLGVSGAALKGAATYATGLADSTYQNQFANAQTRSQDFLNLNTASQGNLMNRYNRLAGPVGIGANAASQVATNQTSSAATQGGLIQSGGQAQAAGTLGIGNAITGAANNYLTFNALQNLTGGGGGGGGGGGVIGRNDGTAPAGSYGNAQQGYLSYN